MKTLIPSALIVLTLTSNGFAQTVIFVNNLLDFDTTADRLVYRDQIGSTSGGIAPGLVGTQFKAQLYAGTDVASLAPVGAVASFRIATTLSPGTWSGGSRLLPFALGSQVLLQVRAWDGTTATTYEQAAADNLYSGMSAPFAYTVPPAGSPVGAYYMENLRAFAVVPEPETFLLAGVGVLGWLTACRRKKIRPHLHISS